MLTSDDIFDWYDVEWYFCYKYVIARHLRSVEVGRWKEKDLPRQNFFLRSVEFGWAEEKELCNFFD